MRKNCLLLLLVIASMANAKVAFLLRENTIEGLAEGAQYNERAAAAWFNTNYVGTSKGAFVAMDAIPTTTATYDVLWINIDDNGSGDLPVVSFTSEVMTAITNYVKAGGNLLLTKRASRIAAEIGRMTKTDGTTKYMPSEEWRDACRVFVNAKIAPSIQERDASHHPIFENVPLYNSEAGHFLLSSSVSDPDKGYIWTEMERADGGARASNGVINHLNEFQDGWNCQVLAVWGSVTDYCAPVIVEFYPKDDFKGTILSIGSASYKWGTSNTNIANVQTLTSNALSYLDHNGTEIGYYMPYSLSEIYSTDAHHADFQTARWFYDNYVATNRGRFIHKGEDFPSGMKMLWVHNDRIGLGKDNFYNAFGGDTFKGKLQTFVASGGNLYLTKQACYLAYKMGKIYEPTWENGAYEGANNDKWGINAKYIGYSVTGATVDRSSHPIFRGLESGRYTFDNGANTIPYDTYMLVGLTERTNHNTIWSDMCDGEIESTCDGRAAATDPERLNQFESKWSCKVLGVWGQVSNFYGAGLIEFNPNSRGGKIIANGFAAYQWGDNNTDATAIGNVQKLSSNIVQYLFMESSLQDCPNCFPVY